MKLKYNGPYRAVEVAPLQRIVLLDEEIDIEDEDIVRSLKNQGWTEVSEPKVSKKTKATEKKEPPNPEEVE